MSGKWNLAGVPHRGWSYIDYEDLGAPLAVCEMCEKQEIRHVHVVSHPDYAETLRVGCDCAEKLTGDYVTPAERERAAQNWTARLRNFLKLTWNDGRYGSQSARWKGERLLIAPRGGGWIAKVNGEGGRRVFPSATDAKKAIFRFFDKPAD